MTEETKEPQSLIDGVFSEMNRVREVINEYEHPVMNGAGNLAAMLMKIDIQNAERAIRSGDVLQMLSAYEKLKETEL